MLCGLVNQNSRKIGSLDYWRPKQISGCDLSLKWQIEYGFR